MDSTSQDSRKVGGWLALWDGVKTILWRPAKNALTMSPFHTPKVWQDEWIPPLDLPIITGCLEIGASGGCEAGGVLELPDSDRDPSGIPTEALC